jgi:hypothetical protein
MAPVSQLSRDVPVDADSLYHKAPVAEEKKKRKKERRKKKRPDITINYRHSREIIIFCCINKLYILQV